MSARSMAGISRQDALTLLEELEDLLNENERVFRVLLREGAVPNSGCAIALLTDYVANSRPRLLPRPSRAEMHQQLHLSQAGARAT